MGKSQKFLPRLKNGQKAKRETLVYQVDHVKGIHKLKDFETDLQQYFNTMMYGKLQILCYECHSKKTAKG